MPPLIRRYQFLFVAHNLNGKYLIKLRTVASSSYFSWRFVASVSKEQLVRLHGCRCFPVLLAGFTRCDIYQQTLPGHVLRLSQAQQHFHLHMVDDRQQKERLMHVRVFNFAFPCLHFLAFPGQLYSYGVFLLSALTPKYLQLIFYTLHFLVCKVMPVCASVFSIVRLLLCWWQAGFLAFPQPLWLPSGEGYFL